MPPILRRRHWLIVLAAMIIGANIAPAPAAPATLEPQIDAYLEPVISTNNFSGMVMIARGDRILFQKAYGYANLEHRIGHRPDTLFHIASVSKPFTAAAILRLAERGEIDLHAPLSRIIPDYPRGDVLTVHHLLTHTSGIPNINSFPEYDTLQYRRHSTAELVAWFRDKPLGFVPGARYQYSNSNYNLLAHIIERISGLSYGEFLRREIFTPLGLGHIGHPRDMAEVVPGLADGYATQGMTGLERARYIDWSVKTGNGSLYASGADLVRFVHALHRGRVLRPASLAASFTPHRPNVGYGWFLTQANNREIRHINGRQPGWAAQLDHYVADDVTIVVLSNTYSSVTTPIARAVGGMFFGEPYERFPNLSPPRPPAERIATLTGAYQFGPDYYVPNARMTMVNHDGDLFAEMEGQSPAAFIPLGGNRFMIRPYWVEAEFLFGENGQVSGLRIGTFTGARIP